MWCLCVCWFGAISLPLVWPLLQPLHPLFLHRVSEHCPLHRAVPLIHLMFRFSYAILMLNPLPSAYCPLENVCPLQTNNPSSPKHTPNIPSKLMFTVLLHILTKEDCYPVVLSVSWQIFQYLFWPFCSTWSFLLTSASLLTFKCGSCYDFCPDLTCKQCLRNVIVLYTKQSCTFIILAYLNYVF